MQYNGSAYLAGALFADIRPNMANVNFLIELCCATRIASRFSKPTLLPLQKHFKDKK
jgi:hypothetical protein